MGGIFLYEGNILEMKMGEGKMLIVIMFVYLNVIIGKGVYVVIVNEYLVSCDVSEMGCLYEFLGLKVGLNLNYLMCEEK